MMDLPTFAEKKEMAMDCYQVNMYAFEEMMTYLCGLDWQAENAGGTKTEISYET